MEVEIENHFQKNKPIDNEILKELTRSFFMSIGGAFQLGKALFSDLSKPQLLLDLTDQIASFEQVL